MASAEGGFAELAHGLVVGCYLLGTILTLVGTLTRRKGYQSAGLWLAAAGLAVHTLDIGMVTSQPGNSLQDGRFYFSLLSWLFVLSWFLVWKLLRIGFLALTAAPLALLCYIASQVGDPLQVSLPKHWALLFFGLHIGALFVSLALLALAFGAGVGFLRLERKIKSKERLEGSWADQPSLSSFDRVNHWAVVLGFPLYTLGLLSGFAWARMTWGHFFSWDPKEIAALGIWLLFAYLFHQRYMMGWLGRKAAMLAIWVFALAVLSMFGINFLVPSHHHFLRPTL